MKKIWLLGRWHGVPVTAHWSLLLVAPWYYLVRHEIIPSIIALAAYLALLLSHELGHAAMARWRRLAVEEIHVSLFHGRCVHEAAQYEIDDIWIAWGGVAAQALLLVCSLGANLALAHAPYYLRSLLDPLFFILISVNLIVMVMNLLPLESMDGELAWRFVPRLWARLRERFAPVARPGPAKVSEADAAKIATETIRKIMQNDKS